VPKKTLSEAHNELVHRVRLTLWLMWVNVSATFHAVCKCFSVYRETERWLDAWDERWEAWRREEVEGGH